MFPGYQIGVTLYMPVIHPKARAILAGEVPDFSRASVVLCLEDAVGRDDVQRGLAILREGLEERRGPGSNKIFVRPRDVAMAARIAAFPGIGKIDGLVVPKLCDAETGEWFSIARTCDLTLMPTLETVECFDPAHIHAVADLLAPEAERIAMVRIGGNDLLSCLGLRRERRRTAYEGALGWVLPMISSILISRGLPVAAPVYDIIDDLDTLAREVDRDVAMGFQSKTAIHPDQIPVIEDALAVGGDELAAARAILNKDAAAIFQIGGVMCEPATHTSWAKRIVARHHVFGVRGEKCTMRAARSV